MNKKSIDHLEADIKETLTNSRYGFTKIKNIVCKTKDLEEVLFIIKQLKKDKKLKDFENSPKYAKTVKQILEAYDIKE